MKKIFVYVISAVVVYCAVAAFRDNGSRHPYYRDSTGGKMKKFFKYVLGAVAVYCTVNWLADNPDHVNGARNTMNKAVAGTKKCIDDL